MCGNINLTKLLLASHIISLDNIKKQLHHKTKNYNMNIIEKNCINLNQQNHLGFTSLMYCAYLSSQLHVVIAELLLSSEISVGKCK
jgi:hypothetical protein